MVNYVSNYCQTIIQTRTLKRCQVKVLKINGLEFNSRRRLGPIVMSHNLSGQTSLLTKAFQNAGWYIIWTASTKSVSVFVCSLFVPNSFFFRLWQAHLTFNGYQMRWVNRIESWKVAPKKSWRRWVSKKDDIYEKFGIFPFVSIVQSIVWKAWGVAEAIRRSRRQNKLM